MNLELTDIVLFIAIGLITTFWWQGKAVKESAFFLVKQYCKKMDVQLLDDTIAIAKNRFIWQKGQLKVKRIFTFEFTSTGKARYQGKAIFIGSTLDSIFLDIHHLT